VGQGGLLKRDGGKTKNPRGKSRTGLGISSGQTQTQNKKDLFAAKNTSQKGKLLVQLVVADQKGS